MTNVSDSAILRVHTNNPATVSLGIEDSSGTVYGFMRLDEPGVLSVHRQFTHWLMARARERKEAAAEAALAAPVTDIPVDENKPQ